MLFEDAHPSFFIQRFFSLADMLYLSRYTQENVKKMCSAAFFIRQLGINLCNSEVANFG